MRAELFDLIAALPRCARCGSYADLFNPDRWPMCEACWETVPAIKEPLFCDLRGPLAAARRALGEPIMAYE